MRETRYNLYRIPATGGKPYKLTSTLRVPLLSNAMQECMPYTNEGDRLMCTLAGSEPDSGFMPGDVIWTRTVEVSTRPVTVTQKVKHLVDPDV